MPPPSAPRPFTLIAELSYQCPLHCPYCSNPVDIGHPRYRRELETGDWIRTFGEARGLGVLQLALTGGEPMLRRDLVELCAGARDAGLYSSLITAGTLFTLERAQELKAAGLDHVQISIQSPNAEENDRIAGNRSFEKKMAAARAARELDFPADDQLRPSPAEPRPNRGAARSDARTRGSAARARQHPVLRLGGPQSGSAAADVGTAPARGGGGAPLPRARRPQGRRALGASRHVRGSPEAVHGRLGPDGDGGRAERRRTALPGRVDDPGTGVRQRPRALTASGSGTSPRRSPGTGVRNGCRSHAARARSGRQEVDWGGCRCQALRLAGDPAASDPVCRFSPHHEQVVSVRESAQTDAEAPPSGAADHPPEAPPSGAADHPPEAPPSGAADHPPEAPPSGAADHPEFVYRTMKRPAQSDSWARGPIRQTNF